MQIIISKATASAMHSSSEQIVCLITGDKSSTSPAEFADVTKYANYSVINDDTNCTITVNDEIFFKYARVYLKVAKDIAPFIKPLMSLFDSLQDDIADIERFMNQKK